MIAKELMIDETKMPVWVAIQDIREKNAKNIRRWYGTDAKSEAGRLEEAVRQAYPRSVIYVSYRKNFIAVKVNKPTRHDMVSQKAAAVDTYADLQGYERVTTKNGIIFRIRK